jgi:ABC-type proline/glycine betaine transport system ATPase subunit
MDSDKILVMDEGKVVEFAPPLTLLQRADGYFTSLLKETGKESFHKLKKIAEDKAASSRLEIQVDPLTDQDNVIIDSKTGLDLIKRHNKLNQLNSLFVNPHINNESKKPQSGQSNDGFYILNENTNQITVL